MSTAEALEESAPELTGELLSDGAAAQLAFEEPTRGLFYGWLMLPVAMVMMASTSPGQTFGFSFFNPKFREAFDLSQTRLSATYLLATVTASLALPYLGGLSDRHGLRKSALLVVAGLAGVSVLMSQTQGAMSLFLGFMIFRSLGPGALTLVANNALANWFDRRLGVASGLMQLSMAACNALVPLLMAWLIGAFGWRGAYLAIAALFAGGLLPLLAMVFRQHPSDVGQLPDGDRHAHLEPARRATSIGMTLEEARQHRAFWILIAASATWSLIGTGFVFHINAISEAVGLTTTDSARAMLVLGVGMAVAQIGGGVLADRIALRWLIVAAIGMIAVSCLLLAAGQARLMVPAFAVHGLAQGTMSIIASTGWARYFGRAHLGRIRGISLTAAIAGSSLGPLLMGVSDDYLGGFGPSFWLFAGLATVVSITSVWATPPTVSKS